MTQAPAATSRTDEYALEMLEVAGGCRALASLPRELWNQLAQPLPCQVEVVAGQIESVIVFIDGDELEVQDTVDEIDRQSATRARDASR